MYKEQAIIDDTKVVKVGACFSVENAISPSLIEDVLVFTTSTASSVRMGHTVLCFKTWLLAKSRARAGRPQDVRRTRIRQKTVHEDRVAKW